MKQTPLDLPLRDHSHLAPKMTVDSNFGLGEGKNVQKIHKTDIFGPSQTEMLMKFIFFGVKSERSHYGTSNGVCCIAIHPMVLEICLVGICPAQVNVISP